MASQIGNGAGATKRRDAASLGEKATKYSRVLTTPVNAHRTSPWRSETSTPTLPPSKLADRRYSAEQISHGSAGARPAAVHAPQLAELSQLESGCRAGRSRYLYLRQSQPARMALHRAHLDGSTRDPA